MPTEVYWKPIYKSPDWVWGKEEISHWELVVVGAGPLSARFTGVNAHSSGRLYIDGQVLHLDSLEAAKELGITTYLLTQEGKQ